MMELVWDKDTMISSEEINARNTTLRQVLGQGAWNVTFEKINGEVRIMPCTLDADLLPARTVNEAREPRALRPETLSVWCLDKQEWRSFRVANVRAVTPHTEAA